MVIKKTLFGSRVFLRLTENKELNGGFEITISSRRFLSEKLRYGGCIKFTHF